MVIVTAAVSGVVILLFILAILWMIGLSRRRLFEVQEAFADHTIILSARTANFFGKHSAGLLQLRGLGTLLLTDQLLYFQLWMPRQSLSVPLRDIMGVETVPTFLSQTSAGRPLLKVNFINEQGEADSAAWWIASTKNVLKWKEEIEASLPKTTDSGIA